MGNGRATRRYFGDRVRRPTPEIPPFTIGISTPVVITLLSFSLRTTPSRGSPHYRGTLFPDTPELVDTYPLTGQQPRQQ